MIVAGTGHRPDKLGGYGPQIRYALGGLATEYLRQVEPEKVISGMALGWDQALAGAAFALGIPFVAALPFENQDRKWPEAARQRYARLLDRASEVQVITAGRVYGVQVVQAMHARDRWMVDNSEHLVALWDGSRGGTFYTLEYAGQVGRTFQNLWLRWSLDDEAWSLVG